MWFGCQGGVIPLGQSYVGQVSSLSALIADRCWDIDAGLTQPTAEELLAQPASGRLPRSLCYLVCGLRFYRP